MYKFLETPIMLINKALKSLKAEAIWVDPNRTSQQLKTIPVMVRR